MQYPNYPGVNSQHAAAAANMAAAYSRDPMGYSSYYQQCAMTPHQQAMQMAAAGHLSASSPLNCSPASAGAHLQQPPMSARSPVSSPQPSQILSSSQQNHHHHPNLSTPNSGNGGLSGGGGYHSPQHQQQLHDQQGGGGLIVPHPQLTPGGMDEGMSSDCSDDEGSPHDPSHMPVVYPWMKKIHVGGSGKSSSLFLDKILNFKTKKISF